MTNLPELPESYFWRVEHPNVPLTNLQKHYLQTGYGTQFTLREDKTKLQVSLYHEYAKTVTTRVKRGKNALTDWFFAGENVKQTETLQKTEVLFSRECKGIHPQAVINAANSILKEWTKQQETAKLIGDYPPKKWDYNKEETA